MNSANKHHTVGIRTGLSSRFHETADQEKMARILEFSDMTTSRAAPRNKEETMALDLSSSTTKPVNKPEKCPSNPVDDFAVQFRDIFRFPILLMCLGGLQLPKRTLGSGVSRRVAASCRIRPSLFPVYKLLIILLHLINITKLVNACIRLIPQFQTIDKASFLMELLYVTFCTAMFVSENVAMYFYFNPLMAALEHYSKAFRLLTNLSKWKVTVTGTSLVFGVCLVVGAVAKATPSSEMDRLMTNPFTSQVTDAAILFNIFAGIQYFLITCPAAGTVNLYTFIVSFMCEEFKLTALEIRKGLAEYVATTTEEQLNCNRERHQCLCRIVSIFSRLTRVLIVECLLCITFTSFIFLYGLANGSQHSSNNALFLVFGIVLTVFTLVFLMTKWGQLPVAANCTFEALADANWFLIPTSLVHKIGTFMAQCFGQKVGVDVFGLFKVDSSTPLMVIGTILTYGIVVMQFTFNKEEVACNCRYNCSSM